MSQQHSVLIISGDKTSPQHSLTLLTLKGQEEEAVALPIPDDVMLEVVDGYGRYRAGAIEGLRLLEKKSPELLLQSLQFQLGVPISDVLWTGSAVTSASRENRQWFQELAKSTALMRTGSTLGLADRIKLFLYIRKIPKEKWTFINLESSNVVKRGDAQQLGSELEISAFDAVAADVLSDLMLRQEMHTVAVANASQETKIAAKIGRALVNMGMDVISVTTIPEVQNTTSVLFSDAEMSKSYTAGAVQKLFQLKPDQLRVDGAGAMQYRADIVLIIGKEWGARLRTEK